MNDERYMPQSSYNSSTHPKFLMLLIREQPFSWENFIKFYHQYKYLLNGGKTIAANQVFFCERSIRLNNQQHPQNSNFFTKRKKWQKTQQFNNLFIFTYHTARRETKKNDGNGNSCPCIAMFTKWGIKFYTNHFDWGEVLKF